MTSGKPKTAAVRVAAVAALSLSALALNSQAQNQGGADEQGGQAQHLSAEDALKAMAGMAGFYRVEPSGDTYLYPNMLLVRDFSGLRGTYGVLPQGILLYPTGMAAPDLGMAAMGGVMGSFRVTPGGQAHFQPKAEAPVGMSGMTGPPSDWPLRTGPPAPGM